ANQLPFMGIPPRGREPAEYAAGRDYLTRLSRSSGGLFIDASGTGGLGAAFERILRELRNQYSIGYYPQNLKHDGSFRSVSVKVKRPGLSARTREGWYDN
ncbi:MAG TPA: hypothetical protein VLL97_08225, partial [Acidobacteriota bacterium]|nr:hypothetical protein [Acidobacteriota bacterium]